MAVSDRIPVRRPLKIFAMDPMRDRTPGNRVTITVPNEERERTPAGEPNVLKPGPRGLLFEVVDFDGATGKYYPAVDLNEPHLLMQGGLDPSESNPAFHQQMVYAVGMKVIENVERALGRKFRFWGKKPLLVIPHAFAGANAYFDPSFDRRRGAVLFGYFRASKDRPGENLPGQQVFTCLSHDIVCHEFAHAVLHRLRPHFLEPTNRDVLAFHEGLADIVAIFQHFTFEESLRQEFRRGRGDVAAAGLIELAKQFGWATGAGGALRRALEAEQPDPRKLASAVEAHERGAILVAAVFDAFRTVFESRTAPLRRIAGSEHAAAGKDLHPDLLDRLVIEATRTAQSVLGVCLRALDYMPPVDPTFGDYLRALVTADSELAPDDDQGIRAALITSFRNRGIYPKDAASLTQDALLWPKHQAGLRLPEGLTRDILYSWGLGLWGDEEGVLPDAKAEMQDDLEKRIFIGLNAFATSNAEALGLARAGVDAPIQVASFYPATRVGQDGRTDFDLFVSLVQTVRDTGEPSADFGGIPVRGGCTLVAGADGRILIAVAKGFGTVGADGLAQSERANAQRSFVAELDARDPRTPYCTPTEWSTRMRARARLSAIHGRVNR